MLEQITLGIIQGIAEWLPVSSEGLILLTKANVFQTSSSIEESIRQALFLHFGTFLAALVYFRRDVVILCQTIVSYKSQSTENQVLLRFLLVTTLISGAVGITLIKTLSHFASQVDTQNSLITLIIGCLLLITAFLELKAKRSGGRAIGELNIVDYLLLGIVQGFAALPGLSRSGLTVSALLLRKMENQAALKLSFLMSLPIVLFGNVALNLEAFTITTASMFGVLFSFLFGLATIHGLLLVAKKINFGLFVLMFGLLTIASTLI